MNREIKFRNAFLHKDGSFSHFSYWGAINYKGESSLDGGCFISPGSSNVLCKQWHQQYTGIKDENGKEIYEGDILEAPSGNLFVVKWYEDEMRWAMWSKDTWYNMNMCLHTVVGNIYENPEISVL